MEKLKTQFCLLSILTLLIVGSCNQNNSPVIGVKHKYSDFNLFDIPADSVLAVKILNYNGLYGDCRTRKNKINVIVDQFIAVIIESGDTIRLLVPCQSLLNKMIDEGYVKSFSQTVVPRMKSLEESLNKGKDMETHFDFATSFQLNQEVLVAFPKETETEEWNMELPTIIAQFSTDKEFKTINYR